MKWEVGDLLKVVSEDDVYAHYESMARELELMEAWVMRSAPYEGDVVVVISPYSNTLIAVMDARGRVFLMDPEGLRHSPTSRWEEVFNSE